MLTVITSNFLNILDDLNSNSNNKIEKEAFQTTNTQLREIHDYIHKLDNTLTRMNNLITDDLMDRTIYLKNQVEGGEEQCIKKLSENYTAIKETLSEHSMLKIEILDKLKDRILTNILQMQQYYGMAMSEFVDGKR